MDKEQKDLSVESAEPVVSDPAPHVTKHTPGSWVVHHDFDDGLYRVVLDDSGPGQCVIAELETQQEEYANAHLIAAAPELYEALKAFVAAEGDWQAAKAGAPPDTFDDPLTDAYKLAQAAISKAEGKV